MASKKVFLVQYQLTNTPEYARSTRWITELAYAKLSSALYIVLSHQREEAAHAEGLSWRVHPMEVV